MHPIPRCVRALFGVLMEIGSRCRFMRAHGRELVARIECQERVGASRQVQK